MPTKPPVSCTAPECRNLAVDGSVYCAAHQTKDSKLNRERRTPKHKPNPNGIAACGSEETNAPLFKSSVAGAAVLDKALKCDEDFDDL
jgi:hypothetical protein